MAHAVRAIGLEPEIGIVLDSPLRGPGVTPIDAARAAGSVVALSEILDTRLLPDERGLQDGAADNGSHGGIVMGSVVRPAAGFDFIHEGVVVRVNGRLWGSACGVEALGNPLHVVAWLANELAVQGRELRAGDLVSTGSVTKILTPEIGDVVEMSFANLGVISFAIT